MKYATILFGRVRAGKRQLALEPGSDDDMVCGLDVCDELNESSSDACVNDCERRSH